MSNAHDKYKLYNLFRNRLNIFSNMHEFLFISDLCVPEGELLNVCCEL